MNNDRIDTSRGPVFAGRFRLLDLIVSAFLPINFVYYVNQSNGTPICFDDCVSYIVLMGRPSLSDFASTWMSMWRSWFVPAVYSLFGGYDLSTAASIVMVQAVTLHAAWLAFSIAVASLLKGVLARVATIALMLSVYAQQYYVYNHFLISDSLALAALLFFLAISIRFDVFSRGRLGAWPGVVVLLCAALCASGARDANILVVALGGMFVLAWHRAAMGPLHRVVLLVGFVGILANQSAHAAKRHPINMEHILAGFVLPNAEVREFFARRGVPTKEIDLASLVPQDWCSATVAGVWANMQLAKIPAEELEKASSIYGRWLLSHMGYLLTQSFRDRECILGQSFARSPPLAFGKERTTEIAFPKVGSQVTAVQHGAKVIALQDHLSTDVKLGTTLGLLVLMLVARLQQLKDILGASAFVLAAGLLNAVSGYFGDLWEPNEMMRHAFVGSILFGVGFLMILIGFVGLLDTWARRLREWWPTRTGPSRSCG